VKNKKIILAGGTGFIGQEMTKYFGKENQIIILSRQLQNVHNNRNHYNSLSQENPTPAISTFLN
jgi:NAD dependent epimerase/dehydratase family enzyme